MKTLLTCLVALAAGSIASAQCPNAQPVGLAYNATPAAALCQQALAVAVPPPVVTYTPPVALAVPTYSTPQLAEPVFAVPAYGYGLSRSFAVGSYGYGVHSSFRQFQLGGGYLPPAGAVVINNNVGHLHGGFATAGSQVIVNNNFRSQGGGGLANLVGTALNGINQIANSPAGTFALGALVAGGKLGGGGGGAGFGQFLAFNAAQNRGANPQAAAAFAATQGGSKGGGGFLGPFARQSKQPIPKGPAARPRGR